MGSLVANNVSKRNDYRDPYAWGAEIMNSCLYLYASLNGTYFKETIEQCTGDDTADRDYDFPE